MNQPPASQPLAPDGIATRADVERVLKDAPAFVRFTGWNITDADLTGLDLEGCAFANCRGARADFAACNLTDARFSACDFNNSNWHRARLSAAAFEDCKLTGARISDTQPLGLTFERCLLVSAQLAKFSFHRAVLNQVDFQDADLRDADFREAVLVGCSLRDANLVGARFQGADLRGADLGALKLMDASKFKGAVISKQQAGMLLASLGLKVV